ncbi:hypothetical protein [Paraburkholderia aromaticivorans]|uniref:hypothetical protein n=1 Tax=Paraburkholderia aromaticivorans TaxID=2026199 RepID=UPI00145617A6|nr:hypothetical protein [Paraburkholderia aromaticivorans]
MTRPVKNQPAARPPVDALQYEKLALSAFDVCDRQVGQLDTLITLASSIVRNPAITRDERKRHRTLLELLVDTAEQYQQQLECDRELFQVIALNAKGIPRSRITAQHATNLLAEASQRAKEPTDETKAAPRKTLSKKSAMIKLSSATVQPLSTAPH